MKTSRRIAPFIIRHYYKSALVSWLEGIEPGLYEKYAANIKAQYSTSVLRWLEKYESTPHPSNLADIIIGAFTWSGTPQGSLFWNKIHNLWAMNDMSYRVYEGLPDSFLPKSEDWWRELIENLY